MRRVMTAVLHESLGNIGGDEIWQEMVVHPSLLHAYYHNKTSLWSTLVIRMNFIIMFTLHRQHIILSFFQFNSSAHPHSQATSVLCLNFEVSPHINVKLLGDFHPIHTFNSSIHISSWAKACCLLSSPKPRGFCELSTKLFMDLQFKQTFQ